MTLWPRERASRKALAIATAIPALLIVAAWIGGVFFLAASGAAPARTASPLTLYSYWYWYSSNPKIEAWLYLSVLVALLALIAPVAPWLLPKKESLHGDAKWAKRPDVRKSGLLRGKGIVVGQWGGRLLTHGGTPMVSPHVYLAAQTGSGKSEGVMIPNALTWPGSMVALDVKQQLFDRTAGFRARHGQKVFLLNFAPRDYRSDLYNPYEYVSRDPNFLVADVQRITNYLIQMGKGDDFWPLQARQLCIGLALYLFSIGEVPTLPKVRALALVGADGTGLQKWCQTLASDPARLAQLHPEARMSLSSFAASAENTASGIAQTVTAGLTPFVNDLTAAVVSGNSFDLRKLRDEPMSIYVVVRTSDLEAVSPVLRLFFQQTLDLNTDIEFGKSPTHRCEVLLGMDEFVTIGRVPAIQKGAPFIRSYGFYLLAIFQSPAQLASEYTSDGAKAFSDNFGCAIFYTPAAQDAATAEHLSKILGNKTMAVKSKSRRGSWGWDDKSRSETVSEQRRPLMLPQEVLRLPLNEAIIIVSGMPPIRAKKPFAARDRLFVERYAPPPSVPLVQMQAHAAPVPAPSMRPVMAADVAMLDSMDLSDVSLDFSDVVLPKEPVTETELEELCNKVYERVMMPVGAVADAR